MRAQVADLTSEGNSLLLVEGPDDCHAFYHIFRHVTGRRSAFQIGCCGNDTAVLDTLSSVVVGSRTTKSTLGAVLDADRDTGVMARLQSIRQRLQTAYEIPATFPQEGLIVSPKPSRVDRERLPVIGIWIMPDNTRDGIFEDLIGSAMLPNTKEYIATVVDRAKRDSIATFRDVERAKVIVKTHMAWQDPNKKNLGEALGSHFELLNTACGPFVRWLERLFGDPAQR